MGTTTNPRTTAARRRIGVLLTASALLSWSAMTAQAVQLQSHVRIKGAESSKLIGMGLVVGLNGTGDNGKFMPAMRPLVAMIKRTTSNQSVLESDLKDLKNVALVYVTARIPESGITEGDALDIHVASVGASSLKGGRLVLTPLLSPLAYRDTAMQPQTMGFAEGPITLENPDAPTTGVIPAGGRSIVRIDSLSMDEAGRMTLVLNEPIATWPMAHMIATLINDDWAGTEQGPIAAAISPRNVVIQVPRREQANPSAFISRVLEMQFDPSLVRTGARVVINEKTGTIVITGDVQISPVVISHAGMTITTITPARTPTPDEPQVDQRSWVGLDPLKKGGAKLDDLLTAFNQLKVPAEDRIAILKEIHRSGKLHAQLIVEN